MKTKAKTFDCVEMMHEGALRIYQETKDMTVAEELAYWQRKNAENEPHLRPTEGEKGHSR